LSCFFSNFQPNRAMLHFQTLAGAAALYDAAFTAWFRALEALPLNVHVLRYESMIADLEGEMRRMMTFLDLPWTDAVLDNQANAAKRGQIKTASYAQVIEPIYTRSLGRWHAYRRHLEPVMPVMKPWIERLGYTLDPDA
ncbi:MAG TPA: sulfotransferase, partial [Sphingomonas sp.]